MNDKPKAKTDFVVVRLPRPLCVKVEKFVRNHDELGYVDLDDFVLNAVRDKMDEYAEAERESKKKKK